MQPLVQKYLDRHPELKQQEEQQQEEEPVQQGMTLNQILLIVWIVLSFICGVWVKSGNPKEGIVYCGFWGSVISFATLLTIGNIIAKLWLAYNAPKIATNIYRGLSHK